ncbi:MAG TPA: RNA polymerase sigma-70 factor [Bacteroidales bacterium]
MTKDEILNIEITKRIKQDDTSAFELLFKLYHKQLCNYARIYVKHLEISDEIVQETFVKIWEVRETLDERLSLKAFLYRCVHNNSINYIKKMQVTNRLSKDYINEMKYRMQLLELETADKYFDKFAAEELESCIQRLIDELPAQCREVFLLSRFKEMSYQEIANQMSISINTVKTQLSRALQKLRAGLSKF